MHHHSPPATEDDQSPEPRPPSCRVERWRGYTSSTFVLRTPTGETFESPSFRWRKAGEPPDEGDARRAYDELIAHLAEDGWTQAGHGDAWYEAHLTHPALTALPAATEQPAPAPAPMPAPAPATAPEPVPEPAPAPRPPAIVAVVEPPPPPVVLRRAPAPAELPARPPRRRGFVAGVCVGAAAAGIVVALLAVGGGHPTAAPTTSVPAPRAQPKPKPKPLPKPTPKPAPKPAPKPRPTVARRVVHVGIAAVEAGSWVEVRRGSEHGRVLFSGLLEPGRTLRFEGRRLWARLGAAGHLRITQNGRPVVLQGTYDKLFRPR